jgi:chitodextrinase
MLTINKSRRSISIRASLLLLCLWLVMAAHVAHAGSCTTVARAPSGLTASGTVGTGTFLHWSSPAPPADCAIDGYIVSMNGAPIATSKGTSFAVTGLSPSTAYTFTVQATDADGTSAESLALNVTTPTHRDAYFVSKSGSDSNPGTASAPWLTISHAASKVSAGDTVYVGAGTYHESVPIATSGTASAPITFDGQGVAIVDGTHVRCCTSPAFVASNGFVGSNTQGLFTLGTAAGLNYVTVEGFTIQNYKTTNENDVPAGILIVGGGTGIDIFDNTVQNIRSTAKQTENSGPNAYGIGVFGTSSTPLSLNVSYNIVTGCLTGESETVTFNGNVQDFIASYNTIHGNDNIGLDAIGFEGVGPTGADQAKNGDIFGNIIFNNSAINNPGEQGGGQDGGYDQNGLYCDGCTQVVFERNLVYANDINIEAASENEGEVSSDVIIRNNVTYGANSVGMTVGGFAESGTGGSTHITIVNNSLYDDDLQNTGSGEFQIQFRATGIVFENNIVYAGAQGLFVNGYVPGSGVTLNHNDFFTTSSTIAFELNGTMYSSFAAYRSGTGQDEDSIFANPDFDALPTCTADGTIPPGGFSSAMASTCTTAANLDLRRESPATNVGDSTLGTPSGSGYSKYERSQPFVGSVDFDNNPRVNSSGEINIGAYEE